MLMYHAQRDQPNEDSDDGEYYNYDYDNDQDDWACIITVAFVTTATTIARPTAVVSWAASTVGAVAATIPAPEARIVRAAVASARVSTRRTTRHYRCT